MSLEIDLSGRRVLVTGASRGIGAAIARTLAAAGAAVAVHYNREKQVAEALAAELGRGAAALQADLDVEAEAAALFNRSVEALGGVDVLVNNAGIAEYAPLDEDTALWSRKWDRTLRVNLKAAALLSKAAVSHFRSRNGGRIIFIASRAGFRGDTPDFLAYAASKGGMVALSGSIARGLGKENIVSFVVAPGFTRTDMTHDFTERYGERFAEEDIALPELTRPEDVAPTVAFLASGLMDHATGCTIDINAGSYVH